MIFMATVKLPVNKMDEFLSAASKLSRLPPYIKKWQVLLTIPGKGLFKSYQIIFADKEKTVPVEL